jgi:cyclophilin family peptidyl-prolyl cis-trans isomerase
MSLVSRFGRTGSTTRTRLAVEELECREVPANLQPINDFFTPNTKALYVPLSVTDANGAVTYTATSTDARVHVEVITGGTTIKMTVTGKDAVGNDFTGDLTFRLFDSLAPITTARIITLVNQGFYNGLTFHRILNGFVAQGGDPDGDGTGGSGVKIPDEFNTLLTFNSPGLLAMANSGDDTGDSQFFITDIDLLLADEPQHLNFNHTIFGQLVAGFDTFNKIMTTPVSGQNGFPVDPVTIVSASVVTGDPNGVLRVTAPSTFTGSTSITVTPSDGGASTGRTFGVTFVVDARNEPPFLGTIANQTTTVGTGITFQLTSTDLEGNAVTYSVLGATNGSGQAITVQSTIDQATGRVTVTPPAGYSGPINLKVGVKDSGGVNDTQVITLTVAGNIDLNTASDTGVLNDDNVTGSNTPTLTILAPAGQTVSVTVNGASAGTATPTATAGQYTITLPAGLLRVGANTIAGTAGSTALTPFTLTYAPSLRSMYVVPGAVGAPQQVIFTLTSAQSAFESEYGYFKVDNANGAIGGLLPGAPGYFAAAMNRRQVVFAKGTAVQGTTTINANGGEFLVMYLVQNNTSANLLASNPNNARTGSTVAFFSLTGGNPDSFAHVSSADDTLASQAVYGWEDLTGGGDRDYNDVVISVRAAGSTPLTTLQVPGATSRTVSMTAELKAAKKTPSGAATTTAKGEIGFFLVDNAAGAIGSLTPGSPGYVAAALAAGRSNILFAQGAAVNNTTTLALTGGQFVVFYFVPNGSAAQVLASNSINSGTESPVAFFSAAAANPDGKVHARSFQPERVTRTAATIDDPTWIHMMGKLNGGESDFDDAVFTVRFGSV